MPFKRQIAAFGEQAEVLATMNVGALWDRMLGEFLAEWARLDRQALDPAAMERQLLAFMEDLSDKDIEDLARKTSSVAYNYGRSAEILSAAMTGEVQFAVRSAILETGVTCDACWNLDGLIVDVDTPEYKEFHPPAKCLGLDRCRCFYVPVRSGLGVAA